MIPKTSVYDQYRLSNSTAVPQFVGDTGNATIQVGQYMQSLYDQAQQGGEEINAAADNVQALPQDQALAKELQDHVKGKLDTYSKAGDWENHLPDVRSLGRMYSSRAAELYAPVKAYQEWQKGLDEKDKNLTPDQKNALKAMALSSYTGLTKDPVGRYTGSFNGPELAKNVDVNEKVDKWLKDIAIQKGGSEIANVDGMWKIKKGNSWESLAPGTIERTLQDAMANDREFQSHVKQEGQIAAFTGTRALQSLSQLNPAAQESVKGYLKNGYNLKEAIGKVFEEDAKHSIINTAMDYGRTKYAYNKRVTSSDISENGNYWKQLEQQDKAATNATVFGDAVTDAGIDISKYDSPDAIEKQNTASAAELERVTNEVRAAKATIASKLGTTADKLTDTQISNYYSKSDPAGFGKYKSNLAAMQSNQGNLDEIAQIKREAMDLAVRKKNPGTTYETLQSDATSKFKDALLNGKFKEVTGGGKALDMAGMNHELVKINKNNVDNFTVIDGDNSGGSDDYIKVRDKTTGKEYKIGVGRNNFNDPKLQNVGEMFNGVDWKTTYKQAAENIRSNSVWMPLLNKATPDGQLTKSGAYASRVEGVLRAGAGGLTVKDANFSDISGDDNKEMKQRISAGKFDVLGIGKIKSDGKMYVKLSVVVDEKAADPVDKFKTVVVGVESNLANKMSRYAVEAGVRDNDIRAIQFGKAMATNSGYEQVLNMGTSGRLLISDKGTGTAKGTPKLEVVPNITGSSSDALSYEVYSLDAQGNRIGSAQTFGDAFDLGAFLDAHREDGKIIEKKTK